MHADDKKDIFCDSNGQVHGSLVTALKDNGIIPHAAELYLYNYRGAFYNIDPLLWREPIPTPYRQVKHWSGVAANSYIQVHSCDKEMDTDIRRNLLPDKPYSTMYKRRREDLDVHTELGWYETCVVHGVTFQICRGLVFLAKTYSIQHEVSEWASANGLQLTVMPKHWSAHPSRTYCIAKPKYFDFVKTFRCWLIRHDARSNTLQGLKYFIQHSHDSFFANLGLDSSLVPLEQVHAVDSFFETLKNTRSDMERLYRFLLRMSHIDDLEEDDFKKRLYSLWARFKWSRVAPKIKIVDRFLIMYNEVALRPGNTLALAAKHSFETASLNFGNRVQSDANLLSTDIQDGQQF